MMKPKKKDDYQFSKEGYPRNHPRNASPLHIAADGDINSSSQKYSDGKPFRKLRSGLFSRSCTKPGVDNNSKLRRKSGMRTPSPNAKSRKQIDNSANGGKWPKISLSNRKNRNSVAEARDEIRNQLQEQVSRESLSKVNGNQKHFYLTQRLHSTLRNQSFTSAVIQSAPSMKVKIDHNNKKAYHNSQSKGILPLDSPKPSSTIKSISDIDTESSNVPARRKPPLWNSAPTTNSIFASAS